MRRDAVDIVLLRQTMRSVEVLGTDDLAKHLLDGFLGFWSEAPNMVRQRHRIVDVELGQRSLRRIDPGDGRAFDFAFALPAHVAHYVRSYAVVSDEHVEQVVARSHLDSDGEVLIYLNVFEQRAVAVVLLPVAATPLTSSLVARPDVLRHVTVELLFESLPLAVSERLVLPQLVYLSVELALPLVVLTHVRVGLAPLGGCTILVSVELVFVLLLFLFLFGVVLLLLT
mmetsp:Transcript_30417/g.88394  ORF Transcript_30417/g.88394 Transcript_30417/m.88394 type:complete len:227 (+) Transcript_30417:1822-2502(+)